MTSIRPYVLNLTATSRTWQLKTSPCSVVWPDWSLCCRIVSSSVKKLRLRYHRFRIKTSPCSGKSLISANSTATPNKYYNRTSDPSTTIPPPWSNSYRQRSRNYNKKYRRSRLMSEYCSRKSRKYQSRYRIWSRITRVRGWRLLRFKKIWNNSCWTIPKCNRNYKLCNQNLTRHNAKNNQYKTNYNNRRIRIRVWFGITNWRSKILVNKQTKLKCMWEIWRRKISRWD